MLLVDFLKLCTRLLKLNAQELTVLFFDSHFFEGLLHFGFELLSGQMVLVLALIDLRLEVLHFLRFVLQSLLQVSDAVVLQSVRSHLNLLGMRLSLLNHLLVAHLRVAPHIRL